MAGKLRKLSKIGASLGFIADVLGIIMYLIMLVFYAYLLLISKYLVNRLMLTISLRRFKVPGEVRRDVLRVFDEKWVKNLGFPTLIYKLVRD
ncbi:hypothetical protein [Thermosphaera sp.]|uniref:Uncharacterized protein n=1 Tax=Thermosphaera aggregans TaxID=54254 RepID=A0A7C2FR09_9CREN